MRAKNLTVSSIYDSDTRGLVPLGGIRERGGPVREGPAAGGAPVGEGLDGELEGEEGVEGVLQPHVGRPLRARLLDRVGEQLRHEDLGAGTRRGRVTRRFRWGFLLFE